MQQISVIDSHTGGEPTRVVIGGGPDLTGATMVEKRAAFEKDGDWIRTTCISEPRGFDAVVGALLCESQRDDCVAGVVFFNNVSCLNGCIHGTIGLAVTLAHLGRIGPGAHGIETPTGVVTVEVSGGGRVTVQNVRSFRHQAGVEVDVPGLGMVKGDVAWGGNWFFLIEADDRLAVERNNIRELTDFTINVRQALEGCGVTGENGGVIDHIEVFAPPIDPALADSKNFVLCPGEAYDRSPCGTGTSAKLACLHASGKLSEGQVWRQAGILDTVFEGTVEPTEEGGVIPTISGSAFVTAESTLLIDPADPFGTGIPD